MTSIIDIIVHVYVFNAVLYGAVAFARSINIVAAPSWGGGTLRGFVFVTVATLSIAASWPYVFWSDYKRKVDHEKETV